MQKYKNIFFISITTICFFGCATLFNKNGGDEYTSLKGITRSIAQVSPDQDPYLIPLKDGQFLDCHKLNFREYTLNGKVYSKYALNDDKALLCPNIKAFRTDMIWKVKKTSWSAEDESNYSQFIKKLGYSKCKNLDQCLSSSESNMLISEEDMFNVYYSDCADLPYVLRAYFAYKNGLPFSFVSKIAPVPLTQVQIDSDAKQRQIILETKGEEAAVKFDASLTDTRYSRNGNMPTARLNIPASNGRVRDFGRMSLIINDAVSSGTLRMLSGDIDTEALSDFYSPRISSEFIKSGTTVYGPKGHAAIVYDVKPNGELLIMDAHPGNSISYKGWIKDEFIMDKASHGGMFKNFRPFVVENPKYSNDGLNSIVSGQIRFAKDEEIPSFSLEQYDSNNFTRDGKKVSLQEWTQLRLSGGKYRIEPMYEIRNNIHILCESAKGRAQDVQDAFDNGVSISQHIPTLPANIFAATDAWETFATPSRDLRLRNDTLGIFELAKNILERYKNKDPMIVYSGKNLKDDFIRSFQIYAKECNIEYKNSDGQSVKFNLLGLLKRLPALSFDPYMCPEIRWGATSAKDLATCKDAEDKKAWHKYTQFLRNNLEKDTNANHAFTLEQLKSMDATKQIDNNPNKINYDIISLLQGL